MPWSLKEPSTWFDAPADTESLLSESPPTLPASRPGSSSDVPLPLPEEDAEEEDVSGIRENEGKYPAPETEAAVEETVADSSPDRPESGEVDDIPTLERGETLPLVEPGRRINLPKVCSLYT